PLPPDADAQQAEALKIGHWLRASFVLRPFVVEGTQEPWLTVVNPQNMFQPESSLGKFSSPQLAALDKLPLPEDLALLAETALAFALSVRHSDKEAAWILDEVLKSPTLPDAALSRWALHETRGEDLLDAKETREAITEFREVIRLRPDDPVAYNNLGLALDISGQPNLAVAEYREAIRLKPDDANAHTNLANVLAESGKLGNAIAEFTEAIRLDPGDVEAYTGLGNAHVESGQLDAAITEYRAAIRLKPDDADAHFG